MSESIKKRGLILLEVWWYFVFSGFFIQKSRKNKNNRVVTISVVVEIRVKQLFTLAL